jgi:hypothetical protein
VLTQYIRHIAAMTDDQLELFVDAWMARKKASYVETEVWAGTGDKGRDVVGYLTHQRLDGPCTSSSASNLNQRSGHPMRSRNWARSFIMSPKLTTACQRPTILSPHVAWHVRSRNS